MATTRTKPNISATLADGDLLPRFAWPGAYSLFYITRQGGILCPDCVNDDPDEIAQRDINLEDPLMYCDGCGKRIPSAYGDEQ